MFSNNYMALQITLHSGFVCLSCSCCIHTHYHMTELNIPSASGQAGLMVDSPPGTINRLQLG